jgi:tryptophan synthase alpha chain
MSRITARLEQLKNQNRTALIPYLTAGDPEPGMTVDLMHTLVAQGADLIELGVPFSDPMADGPVIQKAVERALAHGVSLNQVLQMVSEFRQADQQTPVLIMGYLNPIEAMGFERFAEKAKQVGLDGVLTVDLPPEESNEVSEVLSRYELDQVFLVSPTTPQSRLNAVAQKGSGFVYYVSLKGVTGSGQLDVESVAKQVGLLKQSVALPVGIGFGIRDAESAYNMAKIGEAVIIGSALVGLIEQNQSLGKETIKNALIAKVQELRDAIDRADKGEGL